MVTRDLQQRFGLIVASRRDELGLSRPDVRSAGGPSVATMARIEHPQPGTAPPSPATLRLLDTGLRWRGGSAAHALHGGDPAVLEAPSLPTGVEPESGRPDPLNFRVVELDIDLVDALIVAADRAFQLCDRTDLPEPAQAAARSVREQLGLAIGRLAAAQATEVLERAGGPGHPLPRHIERLIGAQLATPLTAEGAERENQQYRRWLAGTAADVEPQLAQRFLARWRSKLNRVSELERDGG